MSAVIYREICERVWAMYEDLRGVATPGGKERRVLLPPPCRKERVDLLIVGMSPNNNARIRYGATQAEAVEFARVMEYVAGRSLKEHGLAYDPYYGPLLKLARKVDPSFGTWWQVEQGTAGRLVEFTDLLHVATEPRTEDFDRLTNDPSSGTGLRKECLEILKMELELYRPRAILCNGWFPTTAVYKLCTGRRMPARSAVVTCLSGPGPDCNSHFMPFYQEKSMDAYSQQRIANEIRKGLGLD